MVVVQPQTLIRWHRQGFRLFWRCKSRPERPPIPAELRQLIREMAMNNPSWGEERIANELLLKPGIRVSQRTVRKYIPKSPQGRPRGFVIVRCVSCCACYCCPAKCRRAVVSSERG
ncbi:MAG: helix-turn-helix domain-containing protein [Gammaproteobacteria bacterium]